MDTLKPPIFEDDSRSFDGFAATDKATSLFLSAIGCLEEESNQVDFEYLMSHILKCMGLFLKLRRHSASYKFSSAEVRVFLESVKDMCEFGIVGDEEASFQATRLSAGVDLATNVFRYGAPDEGSSATAGASAGNNQISENRDSSNSVWQPMYWAVLNPRWSGSGEIQSLISMLEQSETATKTHSPVSAATTSSAQLFPRTKETLLHCAAKAIYDNTEALRLLSRQAPRAAFTQDVDGNTPLHAAAQYTESVENLHCLLQLNPKAICTQNNRGRTPIHVLAARINRSQLPLLECLLNATKPEDLIIQDKDGDTPLHLAWYVWSMKDAIVTRRIFDANPKAALVTNVYGELPIHCFALEYGEGSKNVSTPSETKSMVEAMIDFFTATGSPAESDDYPLMTLNSVGRTPLHLACLSSHTSVGWHLVPMILKACPRAGLVVAQQRPLATPLACYLSHSWNRGDKDNEMSVENVRMLLDANPLAASIPTPVNNKYPLHDAARHSTLEVVRMVYDAYPAAVSVRSGTASSVGNSISEDGYHFTPLHLAAMNPSPVEGPKIIRFLYEKYPEAALALNDDPEGLYKGSTPLHFAWFSTTGKESVKTLCELEPAALKVQNAHGYTPLHFYSFVMSPRFVLEDDCEANIGNIVVSKLLVLLSACPEAARIAGPGNHTPYQSVVKNRRAPVYIQRALLRAAPEVDIATFRDLNYAARRGAMYLLYSAIPPRGNDANDMLLWLKLRESADATLIHTVVSYL